MRERRRAPFTLSRRQLRIFGTLHFFLRDLTTFQALALTANLSGLQHNTALI